MKRRVRQAYRYWKVIKRRIAALCAIVGGTVNEAGSAGIVARYVHLSCRCATKISSSSSRAVVQLQGRTSLLLHTAAGWHSPEVRLYQLRAPTYFTAQSTGTHAVLLVEVRIGRAAELKIPAGLP